MPGALSQLLTRVRGGLECGQSVDFIFNCQMGRGRTTSGMITACLIATTLNWKPEVENSLQEDEQNTSALEHYDSIDGPSEEEAYLQGTSAAFTRVQLFEADPRRFTGEYKIILQLVSVLSHGKLAKRLTDRAIDQMQDVQNLRKAIYEYVPLHYNPHHSFSCYRVLSLATSSRCRHARREVRSSGN